MTASIAAGLAPGAHFDVDERWYHSLPGLSYSGAKVLLDCPARYRYERDHGRPPKREYDLGHVAHQLVLGKGAEFSVCDVVYRAKHPRAGEIVDDWKTDDAQAWRDAQRAAGLIPILARDLADAEAIAATVRNSPSGILFEDGAAEVSLSWVDEPTGVPLRGRVDWLRGNAIVDLKTCANASPRTIAKNVLDFGYFMQEHAYREGAAACGLGDLPFIFVFVETTPPHLVTPVMLDEPAQQTGAARWREAIDLYHACTLADRWPDYTADGELITISLPAWATR